MAVKSMRHTFVSAVDPTVLEQLVYPD